MFCQISKRFRRLVICLVVMQIYAPVMVQAAISDLPPLLKSNVPPNIVFTLDDSGSMQWEAVPDAMTRSVDSGYGYSGFPLPVSIYKSGSLDYPDVTSFNDTDVKNARYRSSTVNTLYYNPATRYSPWIDSSGVSMTPAVATSAKFNPVLATGVTSLAVIDLTNTATYCAKWVGTASSGGNVSNPAVSGGCTSGSKRSFYPATYYQYDATLATACDITKLACFKKVEIRSTTATYPTSSQRTDCVLPDGRPATSCSYAQEIQNFANWFQFWRSRVLVARGGVGSAFAKQGTAIRVGYGAINDSGTIKSGVKNDFAGANRSSFFDYLYTHPMPGSGTPLRTAIDNVGQYFVTQTGASGPWQNTIGDSSSGQATCRQNFHILMTDGYWNGGGAASSRQGDYDSISGAVMTRPDGSTYQYIKAKPYSDDATVTVSGAKGTLADIAMYYWVTDLRSDWATKEKKNVPTTAKDPAFWQHLVHFTVGLGVKSVIDIHNPADLASLSTGANWPTPGDTSPNNVDDLAHAALNSRGDFFSAGNPNEFANALDNALNEIAARTGSAAAVGTSSKSVGSGVKLYTSTYETTNWSGRLEQKTIDSTTGAITGSDWNSDSSIPVARNIFTSNATGSGGIIFDYSNLTVSDKAVFTTAKANTTVYPPALGVTEAMIVTYLSGDQTNARSSAADTSKPFRIRPKLLGDLVNSDPLYVREGVDGHYSFLPASTPGKESYQVFFEANKARQPMLYVGANDGMLHAFNMSTSGSTAGKEIFAYVPKAVIPNLPALADPAYKHQFYVDGSPQVGDAYIGGGWKTILLGTTGAGGKSIFALDITDPATFGVTKVLWEKNVNTNVAPLASPDVNLGFTIGNPQMGRMKDGRWVVIYGNGYESTSYKAVLYVVDLATGSLISSIDTGVGSALAKNGLGTPKLLIGPDATIKAVYAGDLQGNLWKFDFSSPLTGTTVPKLAFTTTPLFTAVSSSKVQPITTQPQLFAHPSGGYIVMFGTGKIFEDADPVVKDTQTVYGIWDKSDIPLVTPDAIVGGKLKLQQQKLTLSGTSFYKVENNDVDWTTKRGWYVDLDIKLGERVITDPLVMNDLLMVTTLIPGSSTDPCLNDGLSTILFLSPFNGGPVGYPTIDTDGNGTIDASDTFVSGRQVSSTFGNTVLRTGGGKGVSYTAPGDSGAATGTAGGVKCTTGVCVGDLSRGDPVPTVRLWRQILGRE